MSGFERLVVADGATNFLDSAGEVAWDILVTLDSGAYYVNKYVLGVDDVSDLTAIPMAAMSVLAVGRAGRGVTYLYQKIGARGEHLKFGITKSPGTRYTQEQLAGGRLRIIGPGERSDMLRLERQLHETLPIGPEERQLFYIQKQIEKGLRPPPY